MLAKLDLLLGLLLEAAALTDLALFLESGVSGVVKDLLLGCG